MGTLRWIWALSGQCDSNSYGNSDLRRGEETSPGGVLTSNLLLRLRGHRRLHGSMYVALMNLASYSIITFIVIFQPRGPSKGDWMWIWPLPWTQQWGVRDSVGKQRFVVTKARKIMGGHNLSSASCQLVDMELPKSTDSTASPNIHRSLSHWTVPTLKPSTL